MLQNGVSSARRLFHYYFIILPIIIHYIFIIILPVFQVHNLIFDINKIMKYRE
jgi:hypothetical protein